MLKHCHRKDRQSHPVSENSKREVLSVLWFLSFVCHLKIHGRNNYFMRVKLSDGFYP